MKTIRLILAVSILMGMFNLSAFALEVDREILPRMTLGGRVINTLDFLNLDSDLERNDGFNVNDSAMLMRFDKKMFVDGVAGAVIGLREDGEVGNKEIRFQQLHTFFWNRDFAVLFGRTRLQNSLIEFPLLRDDDFISYTHVGNVSSANDDFDQVYGDQLAFDWFVDRKIQKLSLWTGTRRNGEAQVSAPKGFDSLGLGYTYEQPEDYRYIKWIRHAGVLVDRQKVSTNSRSDWMTAMIAGIELNLNMNPLSNWSVATQLIVNEGVAVAASNMLHTSANATVARAAARSKAFVTSIRYTARPHLLTRWQAAVSVAYKDYSDTSSATQWSVAPNFIYRIGQGVDLLAQVNYTDYSTGLGGGSDVNVQLGIVFSLDAKFNDRIGERDSILNLEHGYIK